MVSKRKQMTAKNYKSKKVFNKNKNKNKYNLVYMAKPPYGGWVFFTPSTHFLFNIKAQFI